MTVQPRIVELRHKVLKRNDVLAGQLRARFREARVYVCQPGIQPRIRQDRLS